MKKIIIASILAISASFSVHAKDIVDTAVSAGNFKTLAAALTAAGLIDTLKGPGPFTVFAPTDAAFAKLPPGTVDALLKDKAKLTAILTYHVVPGKVMAANVKAGMVKTVQGSESHRHRYRRRQRCHSRNRHCHPAEVNFPRPCSFHPLHDLAGKISGSLPPYLSGLLGYSRQNAVITGRCLPPSSPQRLSCGRWLGPGSH
jgi:Fasciclin domain